MNQIIHQSRLRSPQFGPVTAATAARLIHTSLFREIGPSSPALPRAWTQRVRRRVQAAGARAGGGRLGAAREQVAQHLDGVRDVEAARVIAVRRVGAGERRLAEEEEPER